MANSWFRVYAEFATDPKVQMLSEADQRRLVMLFCFRCNDHVTLQDEEVTFMLRISNDEWLETKARFIAKGFIDSECNILNWDKRQFISDSSAERVARHRAKSKEQVKQPCNVTVTPPDTDTDTDTDTEQIHKKHTPIAMLMAMGVSKQLASDWLKVRKEKKSAPTQTAFDAIKTHAEKNGMTFSEAVLIATENNWAGFNVNWMNKSNSKNAVKQSINQATTDAAYEKLFGTNAEKDITHESARL
jgi:hypothetical protein